MEALDELNEYFVKYCDDNIEDVTIFVRYKEEEGTQMWIKFKPSFDNLTTMNIIHFKKYRRIRETSERISLYGNSFNKILFFLVTNYLSDTVSIGDSKDFIIGIGKEIPDEDECLIFNIDKTDSEYTCNSECPICYASYKIKESIRLVCNHKLCRDCFFKILERHELKCPICKMHIISSIV